MEEILKLIENYGLSVVLLLGSLYALYRFFFFSIVTVKETFSKFHENNAKDMQYVKSKIDIILEFIKEKKMIKFICKLVHLLTFKKVCFDKCNNKNCQ